MNNYSINDLKSDIDSGMDIEFVYDGIRFGIYPFHPDGISIYIQESGVEDVYPSVDELLDKHLLNGSKISDVIDKIELTLH
jgi:hypothetical protein